MDVPKRDSMKFLKWASRRKHFAPIRDRIRAVILARRGKTMAEIANQLEYCTRWVQKWVARYREGGLDRLWDKPRSGAPKHLRSDQEEAFLERISQGPKPEDQISIFHGHHIQKILKVEFDASYSLDGVYSLLARLRLSWITARPCHEHNDPEKMEEWKKAFKVKLKEIKKHSGKDIQVWFQDEARFGQQGHLYRIWAKKGIRPRRVKQIGFKNAYLLGAIHPRTGKHVGLIFDSLDSKVVNIHLKLISEAVAENVQVVLVWDNAGFHKSKDLELPQNITVVPQAPYSPELNPVERIWRWVKTNLLGNSIFKGIKDLFTAGITAWESLTDTLLKSICRTKWLGRTN